jgi:hypothetical protein
MIIAASLLVYSPTRYQRPIAASRCLVFVDDLYSPFRYAGTLRAPAAAATRP